MSSWRDIASPQVQHDLDELLNTSLGFAQHQLANRGEFYPYAAVIRTDGQDELIPDHSVGRDAPTTTEVIASCLAMLIIRRTHLRACSITTDVFASDLDQDAIEVFLEHVKGQALRVILPYTRHATGIDYGQIQAHIGSKRIWINPE